MAWTKYPDEPKLTWHGQMSFPVELTLKEYPEGIRLCRQPIDEIRNLRSSQQFWKDLKVESGRKSLDDLKSELLDLRLELKPESAAAVGIEVNGQQLRYSLAEQKITLGKISAPLKLAAGLLKLRVLVDRSSIEAFADDGQVSLSMVTLDNPDRTVALFADGGVMRVPLLEANALESIWNSPGK